MLVLPDRVYSFTDVPAGAEPRQLIAPHVATVSASRMSDSYVPVVGLAAGEAEQLPRVRGGEPHVALGIAQQAGDLLGIGASDERRLRRFAGEAVDLALVAGGDEQRAAALRQHVVRRIVRERPDRVPVAVRHDAVDGAARRLLGVARLGLRRAAQAARARHVHDRDRRDLGRDRRDGLRAWRFGDGLVALAPRVLGGFAAERRRVHDALRIDAERADLLESRVEQQEAAAVLLIRNTLPGASVPARRSPFRSKSRLSACVAFVL